MAEQELGLQSGKVNVKSMALGLFFVGLSVLFTVFGQIVLKWQVKDLMLPDGFWDKVQFVVTQYANPWVLSALLAGFLASASWIVAMTQLELSFAYPFMSLSFVIVIVMSIIFFGEAFTWNKVFGTLIIMLGLVVLTR